MIVLISKSDVCKYIKQIARASDFILFNGTDSPEVANFGTAGETMTALQPKKSLTHGGHKDRRFESNLEAWLKDDRLYESIATAGAWQLTDGNEHGNAYFILENKVHAKLAKYLKKRILKVFRIDKDDNRTVFIFSKKAIKDLISDASESELSRIDKKIEKAKYKDDDDLAKELRKKRSSLVNDDDDADDVSKDDIRKFLKRNAQISRSNEKSIKDFLKNKYKAHHKHVAG